MAAPTGTQINSAISQIMGLFTSFPGGFTDKIMEEKIREVDINVRAMAINALLGKGQIQLCKQGSFIVYKRQSVQESSKLRGLSTEELLVYQALQKAGNKGLWTKDMRRETNLQPPQSNKALKNLENRGLIKSIKTVSSQGKKVYMLAELTPSKELTGGAWYSGQNFDTEFTNIIKQHCLRYVAEQGLTTLDNIANFVRKSGISKVELKTEELEQIMNMLKLDGQVEERTSTGTGEFSSIPINEQCYRVAQNRLQDSSAFTNIPCGVCPVLRECSDDGPISPKTCVYFEKWLSF